MDSGKIVSRALRVLVAVFVLGGVALGGAGTAQAVSLTCDRTITASLVVTADLTCPQGGTIGVFGDDITVNLLGHTLTNVSFFIAGHNVTIMNGTVNNGGASVNSPDATVGDATFLRMIFTGGAGIDGFQASVFVVSSRIAWSGGDGLHVVGGVASVSNSWIVHNAGTGVYGAFNGVFIANSFVSENGAYGAFSLDQNLFLSNNTINGNPVLDFSSFGDHLYVQGNKFRNSPVLVGGTATLVDLGGNLCAVGTAPLAPCAF